MIRFECDKCGTPLTPNDTGRFILKIEAYAAASPVDIAAADAGGDTSEQIRRIIDGLTNADPDLVEDQTYRMLQFDLCAACHRAYLANPLG